MAPGTGSPPTMPARRRKSCSCASSGPPCGRAPRSPAARLAMLDKLAALTPSQTRRSEESQALQQFSTPIALGFVASIAAALTPADLVLEPSAGTGLARHLRRTRRRVAGPERTRRHPRRTARPAVPGLAVTRFDAAHIHDHLDAGIRPSVVLMNPPFSVAAHVEGRVADAALRHICVRAGAARRGRPPGRHHRRQPLPRQSRLARRLRPIAGTRPRRVLRSHRRPRLCPPRHHRRHAADRDRPRPGRRSRRVSRLARHRARCRHPA